MKKFLKKQLSKVHLSTTKPNNVCQHTLGDEAEEFKELHVIHVKPEYATKFQHNHKVEEVPGQKPDFQDPATEEAGTSYHLQLQISKMAARELEVLSRLQDAEEALARQRLKQDLDRLALIRLEDENARLVTQAARGAREMEARDRAWKEKLKLFKSLINVLRREREKAREIEKAALKGKKKTT